MNNIICREEVTGDYDSVEEVIKSDKFRDWKDIEYNEWNNMRRLRNSKAFDKDFCMVAEIDNKIVGHIVYINARMNDNDLKTKYIYFIQQSINKEYQGMGIGTKLVKAIESKAKNLGYNGVFALGHPDYFPNLGYQLIKQSREDARPLFYKPLNDQGLDILNYFKDNDIKLYDIKDFNR